MQQNETPEPRPFTREDPRCAEVERRLAKAKAQMVARGTPLLLGDRPAWKRVSPAPAFVYRFPRNASAS